MCIFYNVLSVRSLKIKIYIPLSVESMNKKRVECTVIYIIKYEIAANPKYGDQTTQAGVSLAPLITFLPSHHPPSTCSHCEVEWGGGVQLHQI